MKPYYELYLSQNSRNDELEATIQLLIPIKRGCDLVRRGIMGGSSRIVSRGTTYTFAFKSDRDLVKDFCLRFAAEHDLPCGGII